MNNFFIIKMDKFVYNFIRRNCVSCRT